MSWLAGWLFVGFQPLDLVKTIIRFSLRLGWTSTLHWYLQHLEWCLIVAICNPWGNVGLQDPDSVLGGAYLYIYISCLKASQLFFGPNLLKLHKRCSSTLLNTRYRNCPITTLTCLPNFPFHPVFKHFALLWWLNKFTFIRSPKLIAGFSLSVKRHTRTLQ